MAAHAGGRKPPTARNGGAGGATLDYEEVFGGPPRFSELLPSLGAGGYEEIFGGVMSSCTIPFIDLPASARGKNGAAGVNYGEIFGSGGGEFAVPYEELFRLPRRKWTASSFGSWLKESDVSQKVMEDSEISPEILDRMLSEEHLPDDGLDGVQSSMSHVLEEFSAKVDCSQNKAKASSFYRHENRSNQAGTLFPSPESSIKSSFSDVQELKVKISEEASVDGKSDSPSSSYHSMTNGDTSLADFTFLSVSENSARTQSNQVLPPLLRPPPKGANRNGHPRIKMNKSLKSDIDEENSNRQTVDRGNHVQDLDKFSYFRSSEVDASSDASVSSVTMKEAIDQVQAKLKSAKELLERTREHVPIRKNLQSQQGITMEGKKDHVVHETKSRSVSASESWETLLKEDEEIAELLAIQRQNTRRKSRPATGVEIHEDGPKEGVKFENEKLSSHNSKIGEQKTGKLLLELFKSDDSSSKAEKRELEFHDESTTIKSFKTDMKLNNEKGRVSDMAEMPYEVKKSRKMWAINEIHEYDEDEENEIEEILTAIRAAHGEEATKGNVEDGDGVSFPEECTKVGVRSSLDCYIHEDEIDLEKDNEKRASFDRNNDEWSDENISTFRPNKSYKDMNLDDEVSTPIDQEIEFEMPNRYHVPLGGDVILTHYYSDNEECENRSEEAEGQCFPEENKIESVAYMGFVGVNDISAVDELDELIKKSRVPTRENFEQGKVEAEFIHSQTKAEAAEEIYQCDENDYKGEENRVDALENEADKEATQMPFELESWKMESTEEDHEHGNKKFVEAHLVFDPEIEYNKINANNFFQAQCEESEVSLPEKEVDKSYSVDISCGHTSACEKTNIDATERMEKEDEAERIRKLEEEKEREREKEKDRAAVEKATREARQRLLSESREKAARAVVERITTEARQRAFAEAREKAEKAAAEALKKSLEKSKLRAERAAVERATAEARERAMERAVAERSSVNFRERGDRFNASSKDKVKKDDDAGDSATKLKPSSTEALNSNKRQSSGSSSSFHKHTEANNIHKASNGNMEGVVGESALRRKAALARHQRTVERAAKALAEKNMRDIVAQREQAERNRLSESLDAEVRRWSIGKEGNLRALLSTLQYVLGPDSGWQPIPLTDMVTAAAVKKAYRKATLCVHPDKLQQRRASTQQKYTCEKVFDLLKEAWNKFNSEER